MLCALETVSCWLSEVTIIRIGTSQCGFFLCGRCQFQAPDLQYWSFRTSFWRSPRSALTAKPRDETPSCRIKCPAEEEGGDCNAEIEHLFKIINDHSEGESDREKERGQYTTCLPDRIKRAGMKGQGEAKLLSPSSPPATTPAPPPDVRSLWPIAD